MLKERPFPFPLDKQLRVICDTDANNEADDQYCIAHMLMTPRFDVKAFIAEHYGPVKNAGTEQKSYEEIKRVLNLMGLANEVPVLHGADAGLEDERTPIESEGAQFIIEEAMKDDPRPLFVCGTGAITNIASALLLEPLIADKITVIWIGGDAYPQGGKEYNLLGDIHGASAVFRSNVELWQVPKPVYITMKASFFELMNHVYPCGELGKYLVKNTMRVAEEHARLMEDTSTLLGSRYLTMSRGAAATSFAGELWCLGDSPVVGLMLNHTLGHFHMEDAPCRVREDCTYDRSGISRRSLRVYDDIDSRFIMADFFEKIKYYFG
ncbi:MAG: nucleoside hydrolase [Lachnospiraceae bacterium]|jgi:purine nucleosidase|nr:nucleoside hydrolase [Lachnospiraceae bacterium]